MIALFYHFTQTQTKPVRPEQTRQMGHICEMLHPRILERITRDAMATNPADTPTWREITGARKEPKAEKVYLLEIWSEMGQEAPLQ